jgi:hypothetical protein
MGGSRIQLRIPGELHDRRPEWRGALNAVRCTCSSAGQQGQWHYGRSEVRRGRQHAGMGMGAVADAERMAVIWQVGTVRVGLRMMSNT